MMVFHGHFLRSHGYNLGYFFFSGTLIPFKRERCLRFCRWTARQKHNSILNEVSVLPPVSKEIWVFNPCAVKPAIFFSGILIWCKVRSIFVWLSTVIVTPPRHAAAATVLARARSQLRNRRWNKLLEDCLATSPI